MKIIRTIKSLNKSISNVSNLGFVPTMGGLHQGHLSLIKKSVNKCKSTLVSIYINPTQFNNQSDFTTYPRNFKNDLKLLKKTKVDFVFIPKTSEIYKKKRIKKLIISSKKKILCGKFRKGHFEGVIDVIDRFLTLISPNYMFLGEKDFQQLFLIKKYAEKKFNTKIIQCKTIRDKFSVPFSSRNYLISKNKIKICSQVSKKIISLKKKILNKYIYKKEIKKCKNYLINKYAIRIDYLEARNEKNMSTYKNKGKFRLFIAYHIDNVRLIDNC